MCGGIVQNEHSNFATGYSIDSRTIKQGDLFIPLIAERDGHDYIAAALDAGAVAHLYSHGEPHGTAIKVDNTLEALQRLGREVIKKIEGTTIGITGSVGKTTTKDMLRSCFASSYSVWASDRSFNNEIGVPLTILSSPENVDFLILEMGARAIGQIKNLCQIASPGVGIVTRIGIAHSEYFGDLDQTILAKGELVESLDASGLAVLNNDDGHVKNLKDRTSAEVLLYGAKSGDVVGQNISVCGDLKTRFHLRSPWGNSDVLLNVPGAHNVTNALAAAATALYFNVPIDEVISGLESVEISPLRNETFRTSSGMLVINDSYNANPLSMRAALDVLISTGRSNLVAILGLMAELGEEYEMSHREIGEIAESNNISVISVDVEEYGGRLTSNVEEATEVLKDTFSLDGNTTLLLKGSRVAGLESIADALLDMDT